MSEPLFIVRDVSSAIVFDSRLAVAGACVGFAQVEAGATLTLTYPDHVARSAQLVALHGHDLWGVSTDTALGYPRVVFSSVPAPRLFAVFVV